LSENGTEIPKDLNYRLNEIFDEIFDDMECETLEKCSINDSLGDYLYDKYEEKVKKEMPEILNDLESRKIFFGIFNWRFVKKCSIQFLLSYVTENNFKIFVSDAEPKIYTTVI
jgi:hypothetical protein